MWCGLLVAASKNTFCHFLLGNYTGSETFKMNRNNTGIGRSRAALVSGRSLKKQELHRCQKKSVGLDKWSTLLKDLQTGFDIKFNQQMGNKTCLSNILLRTSSFSSSITGSSSPNE